MGNGWALMSAKQYSSGSQGDGQKSRVSHGRPPGGGEFQEFFKEESVEPESYIIAKSIESLKA